MKVCPNCGYGSEDTAKFCGECGTNLQTITVRDVCWVILNPEGDAYTVHSNQYTSLDRLIDDKQSMLHHFDGCFIIKCYPEQLKSKHLFTPLEMYAIVNFGIRRKITNITPVKLII